MKTKSYQALFGAVFIICSQTAFAGNKYEWAVPLLKEKIESLDKNTKQIGVIDGQKYVVTELKAGTVLIAAKIHADNTYEPIVQAELTELENPTLTVESNSIIVRAGGGHHGWYSLGFVFKLKNGTFYLSSQSEQSNYNEDYSDPSVQIMDVTTVNFDKLTIYKWTRHFTIYKNEVEYKPGFRAWEKSIDRLNKNLPLLGGVSKTTKFKRDGVYPLDNFNFENIPSRKAQ